MKGKIILLLVVLNILLFCFIIYKLIINQKEATFRYTSSIQYQQRIRALEYTSESKEYKPIFYIGKDTLHPKIYNGKYPILICNFSVKSCAPCYETMLDAIAKIFPDYKERTDIIFLSNDIEYRYRDLFHGKKIYSKANNSSLPIEKFDIPYFFIIDNDFKTDLIMHADKTNPAMIESYLNIIKKRLSCEN